MLLPTNEPVFNGLRTSFLRFDGLLSELRADRHSGYVTVEFPAYNGTILVELGNAISATERNGGRETQGAGALKSIVAKANEPGGVVGVFRLSQKFVQLAASVGTGTPLYRDLNSSFTSLERLMNKLRDDQFNGYIETGFSNPSALGLVFLRDGEIADALFESAGTIATGERAVVAILAESNQREAIFNVFQSAPAAGAAAPQRTDDPPSAVSDGALRNPETATEAAPSPLEAPAAAAAIEAQAPAQGTMPEPRPVVSIGGTLAVWSEIFSRAEAAVDGLSQRGTFQSALHEAFLERAAVYPYLDPFAAEFTYSNGQAAFDGDIPENLAEALTNSLYDAIARLSFRLKRSDIEARVRAELADVRSRHSAAIQGFPASARALVS